MMEEALLMLMEVEGGRPGRPAFCGERLALWPRR